MAHDYCSCVMRARTRLPTRFPSKASFQMFIGTCVDLTSKAQAVLPHVETPNSILAHILRQASVLCPGTLAGRSWPVGGGDPDRGRGRDLVGKRGTNATPRASAFVGVAERSRRKALPRSSAGKKTISVVITAAPATAGSSSVVKGSNEKSVLQGYAAA
eukprot:353222-Chlamydomonas_euryale.AAC.9